jgi:hypothetical protein
LVNFLNLRLLNYGKSPNHVEFLKESLLNAVFIILFSFVTDLCAVAADKGNYCTGQLQIGEVIHMNPYAGVKG